MKAAAMLAALALMLISHARPPQLGIGEPIPEPIKIAIQRPQEQ